MAAFYGPDSWTCYHCGGINYVTYTSASCYHTTPTAGWGPSVSRYSETLAEITAGLKDALRKVSRPWIQDKKPDVPRKLGFRRYAFLAPAARVRLNSVQFAIV